MPKRLIIYSRTQPARMLVGITAILTFLAGLWIVLPWYLPFVLPAASTAIGVSVTLGGALNMCASLPGLWAFRRNCPKAIARGAFWLFMWYMFVTLTRMVFVGVAPLGWVVTLIVALLMAVIFLEQRYVAATTAVDESSE